MTYVITGACFGEKNEACIEVCPVDCIYDVGDQFVINPEECIDCTMCDTACPIDAIRPDFQLPEALEHFKTRAAELDYSGMKPG